MRRDAVASGPRRRSRQRVLHQNSIVVTQGKYPLFLRGGFRPNKVWPTSLLVSRNAGERQAALPCRFLHIYPSPLHVVLPTLSFEVPNGAWPRS
jgi:hypothetical protein